MRSELLEERVRSGASTCAGCECVRSKYSRQRRRGRVQCISSANRRSTSAAGASDVRGTTRCTGAPTSTVADGRHAARPGLQEGVRHAFVDRGVTSTRARSNRARPRASGRKPVNSTLGSAAASRADALEVARARARRRRRRPSRSAGAAGAARARAAAPGACCRARCPPTARGPARRAGRGRAAARSSSGSASRRGRRWRGRLALLVRVLHHDAVDRGAGRARKSQRSRA